MTARFVDDSGILPETWEFDAQGNLSSVKVEMDVEGLMKRIEAKAKDTAGKGDFGWHVAELPVPVILEYAKLRGIPAEDLLYNQAYADELIKLATHRDYRAFSPTEGKA